MVKVSKLGLASSLLVFLTVLAGLGLVSSRTVAEGEVRGGEGEIACNLSYDVDEAHSVTMTNSTYTTDIGTSTFNAICNDESGFSMYAVGYSNNEYGNNNMLATINGVVNSDYDIATGTGTSGATSAWAMKISAVSGTYTPTIKNGFDDYSEVPSAYSEIASYPATTDDSVGSTLQSTYAIFVSGTQPAGSYVGSIKYTLVHPAGERPPQPISCEEDKVCYDPNTNLAAGSMGKQSATGGETVTLWASNYSRVNYGFAGWNTEYDYSGTTYGPNETITLPDDMSKGLTLYAVWVKSEGDLQTWGGCYDMDEGDVTALTDQRDNDTYAVAKLADGNCWMIENLRLDYEDTIGATNEILAQGYGGVFTGLAEPETDTFYNTITPNSLYTTDTTSTTLNVITDGTNLGHRFPRYRDDNTASRASEMTNHTDAAYSFGNYYSWAAAVANTGSYTTNNESVIGTSICPAGWRLPRGGDKDNEVNNEYWELLVDALYGGVKPVNYNDEVLPYYVNNEDGIDANKIARTYPNNFILPGYVDVDGNITWRGSYGGYWSSTVYNTVAYATSMRNFGDYYYYPGTATDAKYSGRSVRCVTASVQRQNVTVEFDNGVESVVLHSDEFGTKIVTTSGTVVTLAENSEYTIHGTYAAERDFDGWTTASDGTLGAADSAETTYVVSGTTALTLNSRRVCVEGYICYDSNNNDANAPGGTMSNQAVSDTTVTLWASNFGRDGYGFAGWNTEADGSGTNYGPNETIAFDPTDEDGLMLYAMWVESEGDLQGWTCPLNATMPIGTVTALTDNRDGQTYAVAKLADGNCWLIENLRLADKDGNDDAVVLSASNTNNPSLPLTNSIDQDTGEILTSSNSLSASQDPHTNRWCSDDNAICDDQSKINNDNIADSVAEMTATSQKVYSYGVYYNWYSATAGNGRYSTSGVMDGDICPNGWFLPYGGSGTGDKGGNTSGGYNYLSTVQNAFESDPVVGSSIIRKYPNNFLMSGQVHDGSFYSIGTGGLYWTSRGGENVGYSFNLSESTFNPGTGSNHKGYGRVVRCVTKGATIDNLNYMQDFASLDENEKKEVFNSMTTGEQYVLMDSRDNKKYYISKLEDGNIWMTQNLDFDIVNGGAGINSTNTNVPADWTDAGNLNNTYEPDDMDWQGNSREPESYDAGDLCWNGVVYTDSYEHSVPCADSSQNQPDHYHLGNYYNWTAAVAMSDTSGYTIEGTDVNQSICPAGWTLPKGGTKLRTNSFATLVDQQNLTSGGSGNAYRSPAYFAYSGAWEGGNTAWFGSGSAGLYHSSTVVGEYYTYRFLLSSSTPSDPTISYFYRGTGYSIRCMVGATDGIENIDDLSFMQDFAKISAADKEQVVDSMVAGTQYQLKDKRDEKEYYISKLADGNVWMTQNLDFDIVDGGAGINSTNTDVPTNWGDAGDLADTHATNDAAWNYSYNDSESYDPGDVCWNASVNTSTNNTLADSTATCTDRHYHLGNFYNWTAAVAMADSSSYNTDDVDADQSVCPAGWTLPKGGSDTGSGSFDYLVSQAGLTSGVSGNIHVSPTYFTYSGYWNYTASRFGIIGAYWSSVTFDGEGVYGLSFNPSGRTTSNGIMGRDYGDMVRCIAR